ncbi:SUF system NifU family Fe-S cluster assembly protein [bacterium]|nr:SUF system NifU family Fe-S cluster assembly protein [bacterium]MBU1072102.1 SUF system NifU family Fe-S cluster assembly protein [bacterium]MBU1674973.1 SUF system NifU family Fe-S cluster assembly protein [bacterium]
MDDLYREVILDHHRSPRGAEKLAAHDVEASGKNPSCGDEVTLQLGFDGERISSVAVLSRGCAIATASGSILAELAVGRTLAEVVRLAETFRGHMRGDIPELPDALDTGDLEVLTGVRRFPARVKCALLPWLTALEAVRARGQGRAVGVSTTEV